MALDTTPSPVSSQIDNEQDLRDIEADQSKREYLKWSNEISVAQKHFKKWKKRCTEILKMYRDEPSNISRTLKTTTSLRRYNIYWSIVNTVKPHLFMEAPTPFVTRKYMDKQPQARDAAMLLQRNLMCISDQEEFYNAIEAAVDDYQQTARGVTWLHYESHLAKEPSLEKTYFDPSDQDTLEYLTSNSIEPQIEDSFGYDESTGEPVHSQENYYHDMIEKKVGEKLVAEHVLWDNYLHEPASNWENVGWVSKEIPMRYDEITERFGEDKAEAIIISEFNRDKRKPSDLTPDEYKAQFRKYSIFEIWDKSTKQVIWLNLSYTDGPLDKKDDPYELQGFFPCAKPMYGTLTTDSLIPVPDYAICQSLYDELNEVTERIYLLVTSLRISGGYDAALGDELAKIINNTRENELVAVPNWATVAERGGLKNAVEYLPIELISAVIDKLHAHRRSLIQELHDVTGVSDVIRGASDYRETAQAQEMKGDFASMRLRKKQLVVARHVREVLEIAGEIISKHFSEDSIAFKASADEIFISNDPQSGQAILDQNRLKSALDLLRDDDMRQYTIKIDTETLGAARKEEDQAKRNQFLDTIGNYMNTAVTMSEQMPNAAPLLAKFLMFAVRAYPVGRQLEADIEQTINTLIQQGPGKEPEPQGKSPEELEIEKMKLQLMQSQQQIDMMKVQVDAQFKQAQTQEKMGRLQGDMAGRHQERVNRAQNNQINNALKNKQIDMQQKIAEMQTQTAVHGQNANMTKIALDAQGKQEELQFKAAESVADKEHDIVLEALRGRQTQTQNSNGVNENA